MITTFLPWIQRTHAAFLFSGPKKKNFSALNYHRYVVLEVGKCLICKIGIPNEATSLILPENVVLKVLSLSVQGT